MSLNKTSESHTTGEEHTAVPRLRFKGCEGEWTQLSLSDWGAFVSGVGFPEKEQRGKAGTPFYKVSDMNNIGNESIMLTANNYVTDEQIKRNGWRVVCEVPAIFFAKVGAAVLLNRKRLVNRPFLMDNNTMAYLLSEHWNDEFARSLFEQLNFPSLVQVGALPSLSASIVGALKVHIPPVIDEQKQVGWFSHVFDDLIRSASSQLASLRQLKRAMLVKMFPRPGQCVPEIRFKGFEGKWEEDFASRIFQTVNIRNRAELPVLSANQERGMIFRNDGGMQITHDRSNEKTYKLVSPGDFVIHLRSFQGGFAHSTITGIASPAYTILHFRDDSMHDDFYWRYVFTSKDFVKRLELITYGIRDGRSINFSEFSEMSLKFPTLPEQRKIAAFFRNLDRLIGAAEKKVAKLRQVKASLLERMFV